MSANDFAQLESGLWAHINPDACPCKGHGWLLSALDTWHQCPLHGHNVPHPEDDRTSFDREGHLVKMQRQAFACHRDSARRAGFTGNFFGACIEAVRLCPRTPSDWVEAANIVAARCLCDKKEQEAKGKGYSCAFEAEMEKEHFRETLGWEP